MAIECKSVEEDDNKVVGLNMGTETHRGNTSKVRYRQHLLLFGSLLILLLIMIVIWMIVVVIKYENSNGSGTTSHLVLNSNSTSEEPLNVTKSSDPKVNLTLPAKLKIVSRKEWLAQPPVEPTPPLKHPAPYVIISHTATENCTDQESCTFHVRFIQTYHIESGNWWDIGYNFLVGGDGFAYEGRGWKSEGAHTYGYNSRSIGIAFIGTFNSLLPPERQIRAAKQLIEKGVEMGYLATDYKVLAARQLQTTQSPGQKLYEDIKTWPHWAETP